MKKPSELVLRVTQNKAGRWGFIIELGTGADGKRKQKTSFRFDRKKDAHAAGSEWIEEYQRNNGLLPSIKTEVTIAEYFERFMEYSEARADIKPSTVKVRKGTGFRIKKHMGDLQVQRVSEKELQDAFDDLMNTDLKKSYLTTILITVKMLFDLSIEEGIRVDNPAQSVTIEKPLIHAEDQYEEPLPRFLELEELNEFLDTAYSQLDYRFYAAFYLLGHTGMRPGELMALKWQDFHKKNQTLDIYKTIYWENDRIDDFQLLTTKTNYGKRRIDLSDDCCEVLLTWKEKQAKEKAQSWRWMDEDFIFTNMVYGGHPLKHRALSRHLRNALKNTDIKKHITPHSFRHTHISLLAEAGVPLTAIKARVGHGQGKVTERIYMHVTRYTISHSMNLYEKMLVNREKPNTKIIRFG